MDKSLKYYDEKSTTHVLDLKRLYCFRSKENPSQEIMTHPLTIF